MNASKYLLTVILAVAAGNGEAALPVGRSIKDIPGAGESLRNIVSPRFYRSLLISPVEARIVVRGTLATDHLQGATVIHSELSGQYDALALELANHLEIVNYIQSDISRDPRGILVDLLIYQIADGKLAISFAHVDEPGGSQLRYSGSAWMAALKNDKWVTIEPLRLAPHEHRGARTYTLAIEAPNSLRNLHGTGPPPLSRFAIQGRPVSAAHSLRSR